MDSTPALARGGSGDILTGLLSGLLAQTAAKSSDLSLDSALDTAIAATWWHAQAAKRTATTHTELGVDGPHLAANLSPTLAQFLAEEGRRKRGLAEEERRKIGEDRRPSRLSESY
jgi:NAD(P)H-hydrate epimerase